MATQIFGKHFIFLYKNLSKKPSRISDRNICLTTSSKKKNKKQTHKKKRNKEKKSKIPTPKIFLIINQNINKTLKIISDCLASHHIITRDTFDHKKSLTLYTTSLEHLLLPELIYIKKDSGNNTSFYF